MSEHFDYIVVGGGSGGSVLAGRLSEDPGTRVCLLEAGGGGDGALVRLPPGAALMVPTRLNNWAFETEPQPGLGGRRGYQPRGKALGGSSAINAMVYIRGHRWDYDHWAAQGATGWSYEEVLPYFRLSEGNARIRNAFHGNDGPLQVDDPRTDSPLHAAFLEAARQSGHAVNADFNGEEQEGLGVYQVTQVGGERCSVARAYLLPHLGRPNLAVRTRALARRVLFEGRRAVGVEYEQGGQVRQVRARREVLLAAGAFQSPQLLMLSGVGPGEHLASQGLPVLQDLPGVGGNLQDHADFIFGFECPDTAAFGLSLAAGARLWREGARYRAERRGMLTSNFAECGGFLRSRPDREVPDLQLHFLVALAEDHARTWRWGQGLSCHVCLLRPRSRGTLRLADADARSAPRIDPAFLADPQDLDDLVAGFRLTRQLMRSPALAPWLGRDLFTEGVESDEEIRALLRARVDTVYHPVGTCRMGQDAGAVVDPQLRVRGVESLRVVDASVMPTLIGGNTNAPTVMIAEKAVDMIRGRARV